MAITDDKLDLGSGISRQRIVAALITAVSKDDELFYAHKPGYPGYVRDVELYCNALAGAVSVNVVPAKSSDILRAGTIEVDAVAEKFKGALSRYLFADVFTRKAAWTAQTFTAAHVVAAAKYGAILVQIASNGTISTKVNAATQTTPLTHSTSRDAINALPAVDSGKIAIGYILVQAKAGAAWTANTDDMTAASDLQTVSFVTYDARQRFVAITEESPEDLAAVAAKRVSGDLNARKHRDFTKDETLCFLYTSDGTGALTNGQVTCVITPGRIAGAPS